MFGWLQQAQLAAQFQLSCWLVCGLGRRSIEGELSYCFCKGVTILCEYDNRFCRQLLLYLFDEAGETAPVLPSGLGQYKFRTQLCILQAALTEELCCTLLMPNIALTCCSPVQNNPSNQMVPPALKLATQLVSGTCIALLVRLAGLEMSLLDTSCECITTAGSL